MANLTPAQRSTLTNAQKQLEAALARIRQLQNISTNYFKEGNQLLDRAKQALDKLYKTYELAARNQKVILTRARVHSSSSRFSHFLTTLSFVLGYPGNLGWVATMSMGFDSLGQAFQTASVPKALALNPSPASKSISSVELGNLFSHPNVFQALKEADSGKALLAMAEDLLMLAHVEMRFSTLYASLNQIYIQINQLLDGRLNGAVSADSVIAAASRSSGLGKQIDVLARELEKPKKLLEALNKAAKACELKNQQTGVREMERWIWVVWIANLKLGAWSGPGFAPTTINKRNADALDVDLIENQLKRLNIIGPNSLLKVDFGAWTTNEDENDAVRAAFRLAYPGKPLPLVGRR